MSRFDIAHFAGAPLDAIKLAAATAMVVDHVNSILLGDRANALWYIGRIAFPLFSFALCCHLGRGIGVAAYTRNLLLLAVASQPVYAASVGGMEADTVFTLALGALLASVLTTVSPLARYAVFTVAVTAILTPWAHARSGVDYGLAGMMFPAAVLALREYGPLNAVWVAALLFGLNLHPTLDWTQIGIAAAVAGPGSLVVIGLALFCRNRPRFLPRYAFYLFYPAHLLILLLIRAA